MSVTLYNPDGEAVNPTLAVVVVNKYKLKEQVPEGYQVLAIGRPTVLGNPYAIGAPYADGRPGVYQRGEAVVDHETWFRQEMKDLNSPVRLRIMELAAQVAAGAKLALACVCMPKPCHGLIIAKAILAYAEQLPRSKENR